MVIVSTNSLDYTGNNQDNSLHLRKNMLGYLSGDSTLYRYLFLKARSFSWAILIENCSLLKQIMSKDKYPSIIAMPNGYDYIHVVRVQKQLLYMYMYQQLQSIKYFHLHTINLMHHLTHEYSMTLLKLGKKTKWYYLILKRAHMMPKIHAFHG